jgi:protein-S-isoprenylcysteine O-methyltransferase Ste14
MPHAGRARKRWPGILLSPREVGMAPLTKLQPQFTGDRGLPGRAAAGPAAGERSGARPGALTMRATEIEFRQRFLFIGGIFVVAFALYRVDHVNVVQRMLDVLAPTLHGDARQLALRCIYLGGAALGVLGVLLRTWATAFLRAEVVHDHELHSDRLVADGPYRHVRNPLYLGLMLLVLGMAPLASTLGALVMVVGQSLFVARLAGREEAALLAEHGESFRRYLQAVPRFVPALRPRLPSSGAVAHWGRALVGESFLLAMVAGIVAFAITFNLNDFGIVSGGCLIYPLMQRVVGVGRSRRA